MPITVVQYVGGKGFSDDYFTYPSDIAPGNRLIAVSINDFGGDSSGNSWTTDASFSPAKGFLFSRLCSTLVENPITAGDTVFNPSVVHIWEVSGIAETNYFEDYHVVEDPGHPLYGQITLTGGGERLLVGSLSGSITVAKDVATITDPVTVYVDDVDWTAGGAYTHRADRIQGAITFDDSFARDAAIRVVSGAGTYTLQGYSAGAASGEPAWISKNFHSLVGAYKPAPGIGSVSAARSLRGRFLVAYLDTANNQAVKVARYNDSLPQTVAATSTIEASGGQGVSLQALPGGRFDLCYAHNDTVKRRFSQDGGRSWGVASTIASGYQDVNHLIIPGRGIAVVALWKEAENRWYVSVGTLDAGGTTWSYTAPAVLVSNAQRGGSLVRRKDGVLEFSYRDTADVLKVVRCRSLSKAGSGAWS